MTVQTMTTKYSPGILPVSLYEVDSPTGQPLEFTVLTQAVGEPVPHRETTGTLYQRSKIACV